MELKYPWILIIGIPLLIFLIVFKIKKENKYKTGIKIANTQYAKKIPYYQTKLAQYKILTTVLKVFCIICICISVLLISRPIKVETSETKQHSRDIFICIDASTSVNSATKEFTKSLKEMLSELNGERVGITIFNTTTVLLAPLTDDYEYISEILDNINKAIEEQEKQEKGQDYSFYWYQYMFEGTITKNIERGSLLIGDGLTSGIYMFPELEEDRSRSIILITDNVDNAEPGGAVMTLQEATNLAKEKNINLFCIAPGPGEIEPDGIYITKEKLAEGRKELKKYTEAIGGHYYEKTSKTKMNDIVSGINKTTKSLITLRTNRRIIGKPEIAFAILIISISVLFILNKKVKI